tara:strand:- start:30803 stop:32671 length:1869 start_codon:yes stop_codon:yes gene_type:complete
MSNRVEYEIQVSDKFSNPLKSLEKHLKSIEASFKGVTKALDKYNKEEDELARKGSKKRSALTKVRYEERQKAIQDRHSSYIGRNQKQINHLETKQNQRFSKDLELQKSKFGIDNSKIRTNLEKTRLQLDKIGTINSVRALEVEKAKGNIVKAEKQRLSSMKIMGQIAAYKGLASPVSMTNGKFQPMSQGVQQRPGGFGGGRGSGFMAGGGLGNMGGMAKAMGYYELINAGVAVPKNVYGNLKTNRGIEASFDAFKQIGIAPDLKNAEQEMKEIMDIANKYGVKFSSIIDPFRKILSTKGLNPDVTKKLLGGMSSYSNIVGMNDESQKSTFFALEQMLTQKVIKAEEFNRQLQNAPGLKQMFFRAFKKATDEQGVPGIKGTITEENMAQKFIKYRELGLLDSPIMMTHLADILSEEIMLKMGIKKGHMVQGEENRLSNAYYDMTSKVGKALEPQILASLISITESFNLFASGMDTFSKSMITWSDWFKNEKPTVAKGFAKGAVKTAEAVVELPKNLIKMGYDVGKYSLSVGEGAVTGDWSNFHKTAKNINKDWFNMSSEESDYIGNKLNYSRIPASSSTVNQEQVIKVILEGKDMPSNMSARVENLGGNSTKMRVESNFIGGY